MNNTDKEYFRLINTVLENGRTKHNRTGIDTIGVFGEQAKFDIDLNAFPILTTKKVWFKGIVHELLWFLRGSTNIKYLVDNDVHIWDEWAFKRYTINYQKLIDSKKHNIYTKGYCAETKRWILYTLPEFIQKIKEDSNFATQWGELGEGTYGGMWRAFPYFADEGHEHGQEYTTFGGVDQIQKIIDKLKTNPDDRRFIVSAWHPYWVDHCALPPCHCLFQFHTEELTVDERRSLYTQADGDFFPMAQTHLIECFDVLNIPKRRLNCQLYQRSCDLGLGVPFNFTSYSLLTAMIAHVVNMVPGVFTHTYGDLHIYNNHFEGLNTQLTRTSLELPKLWLNPDIKDLFSFNYDDIKLIGYNSHPAIKLEVAV